MPNHRFTRRSLSIGGLLLAHFFAQAQHSLSGKITDQTGQPLPGATVFLPDLKIGGTANADGQYRIKNLPERPVLVEVTYLGMEKRLERIAISGETRADFALREAHTETREVVVTGLSPATEKRLSPLPVDILKSDALFRMADANLFQSLAKTPGMAAIGTGPGIAKPVIRGLGYNRVLVVQDGIRQEGQQWGDEHGIELDEFGVDRVEILKGPASLLYGSDGVAGVINLQSAPPVDEGTLLAQLQSNYLTNSDLRAVSANVAAQKSGWHGFARYTKKQAGEFENPVDGPVFNAGFSENNAAGQLGVRRGWGVVNVFASNFSQKVGLVEGERDAAGNFLTDAAPFQRIDHLKIGLNTNLALGSNILKTTLGWQENRRREYPTDGPPDLFFDLKTFTYDLKLLLPSPTPHGWERTFGLGGMLQTNRNRADEALIPDYDLADAGLVFFQKKTFGKTHLSLGLRGDFRKIQASQRLENGQIRFPAFTRNFTSASGSLGLARELSENWTLKINASKGFRSPNIAELASNGVHEGTFRYELGNADLQAENNYQLDLGAEFTNKHITLIVNAFDNFVGDFIHLQKLRSASGGDSLPDPANPVPAYRFAQRDANLWGGECSFDFHPHPLDWLHFENSFSVVFAQQTGEGGQFLPFIPAPKFRSELRADFGAIGPRIHGAFASIEVEHFFPQNRVLSENGFELPAKGYTLTELGAGFEWKIAPDFAPKFGLRVVNLFDVVYQNHLSRLRYAPVNPATGQRGIFDSGRGFVFKINLPLAVKI